MGQKRKRLALSCVDCRRRKVKCDRTFPICIRCEKGGNADKCTYVPHTGLEDNLPTPSEDSPQQSHVPPPQISASGQPYVVAALREMSPHMEVQSRHPPPPTPGSDGMMRTLFGRAAQLETHGRSAGLRPVPINIFADSNDKDRGEGSHQMATPHLDFNKVMVRGKAFSTHYYGPSFAISMLLQFEELSKFVKGMMNEVPSLAGLKDKMAAARAAAKKAHKQNPPLPEVEFVDMIPPRSITDKFVSLYFDTFEKTYRILHVPKFYRDYEAHWNNPAASKPDFLCLLLLVLACVWTVAPDEPPAFVGRGSVRREVATRWINACEEWLDNQSQKHITLAHFQGHILVFLARALNCIKLKREWIASGRLLRFAMAVGMHREPSLLSKKIEVFDQEMRRRLWFTIIELDLLTTMARGFSPTIDFMSWDCAPPRNIDDEDFDEDSTQLPPPKDRSVFTRTSFLNVATESLPLRIEVLGRINSVRIGLDLEAVMQYDHKLRSIMDELPNWKGDVSAMSFAQKLSSLMLYDYILILHIPFASQTHNKARSFYSVASKRDISYKTLKLYSDMPIEHRIIFTDIRDDACRASLALAHDVVTNMNKDVVPSLDDAIGLLDTIVDTLSKRFTSLGQGFHTYWITLSSYYLLKSKTLLLGADSMQISEDFAQAAASRVVGLFQQVLTCQVPLPLPNGEVLISSTNGDSNEPFWNPGSVPSINDSLGSYDENAFSAFDNLNFFDDPFSDMNFDMSTVWAADAFGGSL